MRWILHIPKRFDVSRDHTDDIFGVKISGSCYIFLIAIQDSLRYYFVDDTDSWFFFDEPMNLEISKLDERLNLSGTFNRKKFEMLST